MAIVARVAPLPLQHRLEARLAELERIFGTVVQLIEVVTVDEFILAVAGPDVIAVALDAPTPGRLHDAVTAAGPRPVLRPLWRPRRNSRGETDQVFDGYGLLTDTGTARLANGELWMG